MITQQEFDKLNSSIEKAFSAITMIEGHQYTVLHNMIHKIKDNSWAIEALWKDGQKPGQPTPQGSENDQQKAQSPVLVIHYMELWQLGNCASGYGLEKGYSFKSTEQFTMGVDTFDISLNRIEDTFFCKGLLDKLTSMYKTGPVPGESLLIHGVALLGLWHELMLAEDIGERTKRQEAYATYVNRVIDRINPPLQADIQGVIRVNVIDCFKRPVHS